MKLCNQSITYIGIPPRAELLPSFIQLTSPLPSQDKPVRYGKLEEIHHIFKSDPKSPPLIITLVFTAAVVATFPILLIAVRTDIIYL